MYINLARIRSIEPTHTELEVCSKSDLVAAGIACQRSAHACYLSGKFQHCGKLSARLSEHSTDFPRDDIGIDARHRDRRPSRNNQVYFKSNRIKLLFRERRRTLLNVDQSRGLSPQLRQLVQKHL